MAQRLSDRARQSSQGCYWETFDMQGAELKRADTAGMYQGNAGILFFFTELFRQTNDQRYAQTAISCASHVLSLCSEGELCPWLYTGTLGVCFAFTNLGLVLQSEKWIEAARKLGHRCLDAMGPDYSLKDDFLTGRAGALVGLLHLHRATSDPRFLNQASRFAEELVERALASPHGWQWDRSTKNINGLCGLAHGSAGVGLAFLEFGQYLDCPALFQLAEKAFAFERHYFDKDVGAWPDFRHPGFKNCELDLDPEKIQALIANANQPGRMEAWCNGSPGIALVRARAYRLTGNQIYLKETELALQATCQVRSISEELERGTNFSLCHGLCGNAAAILTASLAPGRPKPEQLKELDYAILERLKKGQSFKSGYKQLGEDDSLLMGNAGIGYYLLLSADPNIPSPLSFEVEPPQDRPEIMEKWNEDRVNNLITQKHFPRARAISANRLGETLEAFQNRLQQSEDLDLKAAFEQDILMQKMLAENHNPNLIDLENRLNQLTFQSVPPDNRGELVLVTSKRVRVIELPDGVFMFIPQPLAIHKWPLNPLCHLIVDVFSKPRTFQSGIDFVLVKIGDQGIENRIRAQIENMIHANVLTTPPILQHGRPH